MRKRQSGASSVKLAPAAASKQIGFGLSALGARASMVGQPLQRQDAYEQFYPQMLQDETVALCVDRLASLVVSRIGEYRHPDERIQELVSASFERVRGTHSETLREVVAGALAYGFSVAEATITQEEGRWVLSSLVPYDPSTIQFILGKLPDNSVGVTEVVQKVQGLQDAKIPLEKCMVLSLGSSSDPYGRSSLRLCYRWWDFKSQLVPWWAISMERYAIPIPWGRTTSANADALGEALAGLHAKGYVVTGQDDGIALLGNHANSGEFEATVDACDKRIFRAFYFLSLLAGGEQGGSYALGAVHWKLLDNAATEMASKVGERFLEGIIRPLIEWNFGPQEAYGEMMKTENRTPEEMTAMGNVLTLAQDLGALDPSEDLGHIRATLGLPEASEETKKRVEARRSEAGWGTGGEPNDNPI